MCNANVLPSSVPALGRGMEAEPRPLLPGGLAGNGQRQGHCGRHLHHLALQEALRGPSTHQLQP